MTVNQKPAARKLRGVIAAIATPIRGAAPDHERLVRLASYLLDAGCDGLNLLGTTGEATSFSVEQRQAAMSAVARANLPLDRMMVGTGAASLADAIALSRHAETLSFAGILLLPPFYYKPISEAGMIEFVGRVADATATTNIPIYLYNFPALSGVQYTPSLVAALVKQFGTRIAGVKDSSGNKPYAYEVADISEALDVFPSTEALLLEARGGRLAGCISATANINSRDCAKAFNDGDETALARAMAVRDACTSLPLVAAVKYALSNIHGDPSLAHVMPPLVELTPQQAASLRDRLGNDFFRSGT